MRLQKDPGVRRDPPVSEPSPTGWMPAAIAAAAPPLLPPADPSLNLPISLTWTGPADGALKEICLQLGYRYRETGAPTAQTMPIVVHGLNRPAHELLEDIAWQIQPQAVVRVDPVNRVLTLASTSGAEGRS